MATFLKISFVVYAACSNLVTLAGAGGSLLHWAALLLA